MPLWVHGPLCATPAMCRVARCRMDALEAGSASGRDIGPNACPTPGLGQPNALPVVATRVKSCADKMARCWGVGCQMTKYAITVTITPMAMSTMRQALVTTRKRRPAIALRARHSAAKVGPRYALMAFGGRAAGAAELLPAGRTAMSIALLPAMRRVSRSLPSAQRPNFAIIVMITATARWMRG